VTKLKSEPSHFLFSHPAKFIRVMPIVFLLGLFSTQSGCSNKVGKAQPLAKDGVLDLSDWDFGKDGSVELRGEWRFLWKDFVEPAQLGESVQVFNDIISVPSFWHSQKQRFQDKDDFGHTGYSSYLLEVVLSPSTDKDKLVVQLNQVASAANIMIWDPESKQVIARLDQGVPGASLSEEVPVLFSEVTMPSFNNKSTIMILIHTSSHLHSRSGIYKSPKLGDYYKLKEDLRLRRLTAALLIGSLLIISLYHMIIFVQRSEDKPSLAFAIFCAVMAIREITISRLAQYLGLGHNVSGYTFFLTMEYLTLPLMMLSNAFFVKCMVPGKVFNAFYKWWILPTSSLLLLYTMTVDTTQFTAKLSVFQLQILTCIIVGVGHLVHKSFTDNPYKNSARLVGFTLLILVGGAVNDILYSLKVVHTGDYAVYTFIAFILMQSGIISGKAAYAYKQTKLLSANLQEKNKEITFFNQNLERLVDDKTREIKGLLDHIPQGVLTIEQEGQIGKNFSAHLNEVLGHCDVADKSFKEALLERSALTADEQDQAWQAIFNAVGCDELGFMLNSSKLPHELEYTYDGTTKILGCTWSPQVKDEDVESILVTLLDVTAEKKLEAEARKQQKEMAKISELVAVPEAKAHNFFTTSFVLLNEIKDNLDKGSDHLDEERVKLLFVNAHTVKGNARTLNFLELTEMIHLMENRYSLILRKEADIDLTTMREDLGKVFASFEDYSLVNTEKLNRNSAGHFINIDRNLIEKTFYMMKDFVGGSKESHEEFKNIFDQQSNVLAKLIFETLPQVFDDYRERVVKIAKDTGREEPLVEFTVPDTIISADQREVLDMSMIHLLRNALDHGIEAKEDRLAKGKSPAGLLKIDVETKDDVLQMTMQDDGKGLPIAMLRGKGVKQGTLTENSSLQEISEMIFASGVSTAAATTDISGRGVGMDAVRQFMERAGGSIEVVVQDEKPEQGFYNFYFKVTLPLAQIIIDRKTAA